MNYGKVLSPSQCSIARCHPVMTQDILRRNTGGGIQVFYTPANYPYADEQCFTHFITMLMWSERMFWGAVSRGWNSG